MPIRSRLYTTPLGYYYETENGDTPNEWYDCALEDAWLELHISHRGDNDYRELNEFRWGKIGQYILKPMCPTMLMS